MFTKFFNFTVGGVEIIYKLSLACQIKLLLNRCVKIKVNNKKLQQRVLHKNKARISRQTIRVNRDVIVKSISDVGQLNQPRLRPRPRAEREERLGDYNTS